MQKLSRISFILFILLFGASAVTNATSCAEIEETFTNLTSINEKTACHCYYDTGIGKNKQTDMWIACSEQTMPNIFRVLNGINETFFSRLIVWNAFLSVLPSDIFAKVRPRSLTIESSKLALFRDGALDKIGRRLKDLNLRNNIISDIHPSIFKEISGLESLQLSNNKLHSISPELLSYIPQLHTLLLDSNQLSSISDGTFEKLSHLTTLNLANNKLTKITRDTFRGLNNLEHLVLSNNQISEIDWQAFSHMKRLKTLELNQNRIKNVELRALEHLQTLLLNNNAIKSLTNISLRDLPSLSSVFFDRNFITAIGPNDLNGLGQSSHLLFLSFVDNEIAEIDGRAFDAVHPIETLSLQRNLITTLVDKNDGTPILRSLKKLKRVYLTNNNLTSIDDNNFHGLTQLAEISLDHNKIENVSRNAFRGLNISKIYLNNNRLRFLPEGIFDNVDMEHISVVDLSENIWECVCGQEWLGQWLRANSHISLPIGNLGCLESECLAESLTPPRPTWVTVVSGCLAGFTLGLIVIIAYLLWQGRRKNYWFMPTSVLKNIDNDHEHLIPSPTSFPNPVALVDDNNLDASRMRKVHFR